MHTLKSGPLCNNCPLRDAPGPVWGTGSPYTKLAIIGISPSIEEVNSKTKPEGIFSGSMSGVFNRGLYEVGLSRAEVFLTYGVKCYCSSPEIPLKARECCKPLLTQELDQLHSLKAKVTLGYEPFNTLSGRHLHFQHDRKSAEKDPLYWLTGYPFRQSTTQVCPIIPLEHPYSIAKGGFLNQPVWHKHWLKVKRWFDGRGIIYKEVVNPDPSEAELDICLEAIFDNGWFGVDIETPENVFEEEDLVARQQIPIDVIGISSAIGEGIGVPPALYPRLRKLFTSEGRSTPLIGCAFNWGFDGFHLKSLYPDLTQVKWFDPMLALHILYSHLRRKDLGTALSIWTDIPYHKNMRKSQPDLYNARDTYGVLWLAQECLTDLEGMKADHLFWDIEMPCIPIAENMRMTGTKCDIAYAQKAELLCYKQLQTYEDFWRKSIPNYSWSSPKQLLELFKLMKMPEKRLKRTKKNKDGQKEKYHSPTVNDEALEEYRDKYNNKTAGLVLEMRRLKKAADFTHIYSEDGFSHPNFNLIGQVGGRIQATDPDLQNIPEQAAGIFPRKIITSDNKDYVLLIADYSQVELWLYAYLANDIPFLLAKERGDYIYGVTYEDIFAPKKFFQEGKPRSKKYKNKDVAPWELLVAKSGPLGWIYGRGANSMVNLGVSLSKAYEIYNTLSREHHAVDVYHQYLERQVQKYGYLQTVFGRIRRFPTPHGHKTEMYAFPGQSTGCDVLRTTALLPLAKNLSRFDCKGIGGFGTRLLCTVHDSVLVNCPRVNAIECGNYMQLTMEQPIPEMKGFSIPISLSVGYNWNDQVDYEKYCTDPGIIDTF
jgi:uracil-DNA glycosylase family 4